MWKCLPGRNAGGSVQGSNRDKKFNSSEDGRRLRLPTVEEAESEILEVSDSSDTYIDWRHIQKDDSWLNIYRRIMVHGCDGCGIAT